jgi:ferredoxin-NADP reductase
MQFKIGADFRAYSIASPPRDGNNQLTFCIQLIEAGIGSQFVKQLAPGSQLSMRGPLGVFTVKDQTRNLCFVATSVGVAPFVSMLSDVLAREFAGQLTLIFGVRSEEDTFYFDKFNHLMRFHPNFKFVPLLSRPKSHWPGEVGRVTTYVDVHYEEYKDHLMYLCGNQAMVADAREILQKHGHPMKDIKLEIFT